MSLRRSRGARASSDLDAVTEETHSGEDGDGVREGAGEGEARRPFGLHDRGLSLRSMAQEPLDRSNVSGPTTDDESVVAGGVGRRRKRESSLNVRLSLFEPRQLGADEHGRALDHAAAIQEAAEEDGAQMQQQYQEDLDTSLPSSVYGDPVLSPRSRMSGDADDSAPAAIDYGQPLLQSVSVESAAAAGSTLQQKQDSMRLKSHPHYKKATRVADDVLHSVMLDGFFDALELLMERGWRERGADAARTLPAIPWGRKSVTDKCPKPH